MDTEGFRQYLRTRGVPEEKMAPALSLAQRFVSYRSGKPATADTAWEFSSLLIQEGSNTEENYIILVRYCYFLEDYAMYVAFMELVDGGEVAGNLYRKVGKQFGKRLRDEVFSGIGIAPYGTPTPAKPAYLQPVITRLEAQIGKPACAEFLSASLRDLPNRFFLDARRKYRKAANIDAYLDQRKQEFVAQLEACWQTGRPFFVQEITEGVLAYVRADPEIGGGRRVGNLVYETKIPYMAQKYLDETDPVLKRYYYCHCPWARESIKNGDIAPAETFCACSGGFHKKSYEVIFQQKLQVDVLESVLRGDGRCRFAIHLPADALS